MSRLSRLRQARAEHRRAQAELAQPPGMPNGVSPGQPVQMQITIEQLVPALINQGYPVQYAVGAQEQPPMVELALKVGPIVIPCQITDKARAEKVLADLDAAIEKAWPEVVDVTPEEEEASIPEHLAELLTQAQANFEAKHANGAIIVP